MGVAELEAHLAGCAGCREWLGEATRITRMVRLEPLDAPDLTASVLARVHADDMRRDAERRVRGARRLAVAQVALLAVAAGQCASGLAAVIDAGMSAVVPVHSARELGSFNLAVAVGFAWVAWRPAWARTQLPLISAIVGILTACTVFDLVAGHVSARGEVGHVLLLAGLVLTAVIVLNGAEPGPPASHVGQAGPRRPPGGGAHPGPPYRPLTSDPAPSGPCTAGSHEWPGGRHRR